MFDENIGNVIESNIATTNSVIDEKLKKLESNVVEVLEKINYNIQFGNDRVNSIWMSMDRERRRKENSRENLLTTMGVILIIVGFCLSLYGLQALFGG